MERPIKCNVPHVMFLSLLAWFSISLWLADGQRLLQEFEKLRAMEVEVKSDLEKLRAGARLLEEELNIYCDLEVLRVSGEEKRKVRSRARSKPIIILFYL